MLLIVGLDMMYICGFLRFLMIIVMYVEYVFDSEIFCLFLGCFYFYLFFLIYIYVIDFFIFILKSFFLCIFFVDKVKKVIIILIIYVILLLLFIGNYFFENIYKSMFNVRCLWIWLYIEVLLWSFFFWGFVIFCYW